MNTPGGASHAASHEHVFLGQGHERNERRTWGVIALCGAMMLAEIAGGSLFGSLALVADGLHMSTHAGAMLIAALAYTYARRHARDRRFVFGTGKLGDLAGFSSAIVLAMIALLIGYEAVSRLLAPVPIHFREAIPIAAVGLLVNIVSAWMLSGGHHEHGHGHGHGHAHDDHDHAEPPRRLATAEGIAELAIYEDGVPPRFRLSGTGRGTAPPALETVRPDGSRQAFRFVDRGGYWESVEEIAEPHAFQVVMRLVGGTQLLRFEEHDHDHHGHHGAGTGARALRDNSIRSAYIHVLADAFVSVLAIVGLLLARSFGWLWMDPLAGIVGAVVIANWSFSLMRDTAGILLDMSPDRVLEKQVRYAVESDGDRVTDLHLWRLGPGHLGAVLSVVTGQPHDPAYYRTKLGAFGSLSHVTVEVTQA
jgi:cation diffusion facilitator family transporter